MASTYHAELGITQAYANIQREENQIQITINLLMLSLPVNWESFWRHYDLQYIEGLCSSVDVGL